ncbi:MAG: DUF3737 family protein [Clostridia bacterium]|nr:DUF3737 family protein [Clostridia bacterium]
MKTIENKNFPEERALYGVNEVELRNCTFQGEEDGESALKEARNISLKDCYMDLRYPLWHDENVALERVEMTANCRAALWYSQRIAVKDSKLHGIKAIRECADIELLNTSVISPEFGWRNHKIVGKDVSVESEYAFFESSHIAFTRLRLKGKYSFQYVHDLVIEDGVLDTKDAFWHTKNVLVKNSVIKGEYLAWYAENITFENCTIEGTQPLCYCKGLTLKNCKMVNCDLSFEYSDVNADIVGEITSVKNPKSGNIVADGYGEIILTDDSKVRCEAQIQTRGN